MSAQDEVPAIEASGIARRFGRRWAVAGVSLRVRAGTRLMVTGRNGSGKSTLLRVLATASRLDQGAARIAGHSTCGPSATRSGGRWRCSATTRTCTRRSPRSRTCEISRPLPGTRPPQRVDALLGEVGLARAGGRAVSTSSPPACASAWRWRARSCRTPACCCSTSPTGSSTRRGSRCSTACSTSSGARGATVLLATHLLERGRGAVRRGDRARGRAGCVWSGPARDLPGPGGLAAVSAALGRAAQGPAAAVADARAGAWPSSCSAPPRCCSSASRSARSATLLREHAAGFLWLAPAALVDADAGRELPGRDGAARARGPAAAAGVARGALLREGARELAAALAAGHRHSCR